MAAELYFTIISYPTFRQVAHRLLHLLLVQPQRISCTWRLLRLATK